MSTIMRPDTAEPAFRREPLRSEKYLAGSRGATCKLRIVCAGLPGDETVVPCHAADSHTGRSVKASDISVIDGCRACHDVFDRRARMPNGNLISDDEWYFYALRGLQETLEARHEIGLLQIPLDAPRPHHDKPTRPRKPAEKRRPIHSRGFDKSQSRKIPSRARRRDEHEGVKGNG